MISGKGEKPLLDYRMFLKDEEKTNNENEKKTKVRLQPLSVGRFAVGTK